jgi:DNA polymerase III subunit gamma/tau
LQAQLIGRDTHDWLLRVEKESLNHAASRERLQQALAKLGHEVSLSIEVGRVRDCPALRNTAANEEKQRVADDLIRKDPFVVQMMRDFGAKIVPGSVKSLV